MMWQFNNIITGSLFIYAKSTWRWGRGKKKKKKKKAKSFNYNTGQMGKVCKQNVHGGQSILFPILMSEKKGSKDSRH